MHCRVYPHLWFLQSSAHAVPLASEGERSVQLANIHDRLAEGRKYQMQSLTLFPSAQTLFFGVLLRSRVKVVWHSDIVEDLDSPILKSFVGPELPHHFLCESCETQREPIRVFVPRGCFRC